MSIDQVRRRPGGRNAQVRSAVLTATLELVAEVGLSKVGIGEVAVRSGVHETSIYRRWRTVDRLTLDALISYSGEFVRVPDTGSLRTDLVAVAEDLIEYARTPLGLALIRSLAAGEDDADAATAREAFWNARHDDVRPVIERAKARGELPGAIDGRLLIEVFIAPIHFRLLMTREPLDARFLRQLADAAITGLTAAGPSR